MVETRTQAQPPRDASASEAEEEIAAAIALVLAGQSLPTGTTPLVAVAALLRLVPSLGDADISERVASLVVGVKLPLPGGPPTILRASAANISYRAHYAIEAAKRVAGDVASGEEIGAALGKERRYLARHLEASRTRAAGAHLNDAAAERWGPLLSWNHTGTAHTHRPSHVAADGANYRVDAPPTSTEGMLPGQAMHCDCIPGPPKQGARTLR